jgi:hypothetical protein
MLDIAKLQEAMARHRTEISEYQESREETQRILMNDIEIRYE